MKTIITVNEILDSSYLKMPKGLFNDHKYRQLTVTSKIIYMYFFNLINYAPLKGWINKKNQLYVIVDDSKFIEQLSIKPEEYHNAITELASYRLIIIDEEKIYVELLEEGKSNKLHLLQVNVAEESTINLKDSLDLILEEQIMINSLKESYFAYNTLINEIELSITEMFNNDFTFIGKERKPRSVIRSVLAKLDYTHIEYVLLKYIELSKTIKINNAKRYMQSMIYNAPFECSLKTTNEALNNN